MLNNTILYATIVGFNPILGKWVNIFLNIFLKDKAFFEQKAFTLFTLLTTGNPFLCFIYIKFYNIILLYYQHQHQYMYRTYTYIQNIFRLRFILRNILLKHILELYFRILFEKFVN